MAPMFSTDWSIIRIKGKFFPRIVSIEVLQCLQLAQLNCQKVHLVHGGSGATGEKVLYLRAISLWSDLLLVGKMVYSYLEVVVVMHTQSVFKNSGWSGVCVDSTIIWSISLRMLNDFASFPPHVTDRSRILGW